MAAHNLTAIACQNLFLFVVAVKLRHMVLWLTLSLYDRLRFADDATPSLPAMKLEEIQSLFAAWLDVIDPISVQPIDAGLTQLHEELPEILLSIPYDV